MNHTRCTVMFIACWLVWVTPGSVWGEARRSVLYPRPDRTLPFAHAKHAKVACARCHVGVGMSTSANDTQMPAEQVCAACHADSTRARPADRPGGDAAKRCRKCHRGYQAGKTPPKQIWPAARLRFSHRLHQTQGIDCASCHAFDGGKRAFPRMRQCMECHQLRRASTRCQSCHLTRKDGRLVIRFGEGQMLRPSGSLRGDAHTQVFVRREHATVARANRRYCETCHRQSTCLKCHAGSLKPMRLHRSDYISHHAMDARRNQPRCSSCHRTQSFCLSCHIRLGVSQNSKGGGFKPTTGLSFHPPGFSGTTPGPKHHKYEARRNMNSCTSCHTEQNCVRCHGTTGRRGGGFSPHPPGFARSQKCRSLAARNQRVCLKCHVASDPAIRCQ